MKPPGKARKSAAIVMPLLLVGLFLYFGTTVFVMSGTKATFSFVEVGKVAPPGGGATTTTTKSAPTTTAPAPSTTSPATGTGGH